MTHPISQTAFGLVLYPFLVSRRSLFAASVNQAILVVLFDKTELQKSINAMFASSEDNISPWGASFKVGMCPFSESMMGALRIRRTKTRSSEESLSSSLSWSTLSKYLLMPPSITHCRG